jgi:hypothetical protein
VFLNQRDRASRSASAPTFALKVIVFPLAIVAIALTVFDSTGQVFIAVTEPIATISVPSILTPFSRVKISIQPPLNAVTAPHTVGKVTRINSAVLQQLDAVAVVNVTSVRGVCRQGAGRQPPEYGFMLRSQATE